MASRPINNFKKKKRNTRRLPAGRCDEPRRQQQLKRAFPGAALCETCCALRGLTHAHSGGRLLVSYFFLCETFVLVHQIHYKTLRRLRYIIMYERNNKLHENRSFANQEHYGTMCPVKG